MPTYIDGVSQDDVGANLVLDAAGGVMRIGAFIVQWGSALSTTDLNEAFSFNQDFPNACLYVNVERTGVNPRYTMGPNTITASGFTINRWDDIGPGDVPFIWFAIGH